MTNSERIYDVLTCILETLILGVKLTPTALTRCLLAPSCEATVPTSRHDDSAESFHVRRQLCCFSTTWLPFQVLPEAAYGRSVVGLWLFRWKAEGVSSSHVTLVPGGYR